MERLKSLESLKIGKVKGKQVPSRLYIGNGNEWELSRSNFQERAQPLDLSFAIGFREQYTAWIIMRHIKWNFHTYKQQNQMVLALKKSKPHLSPRMGGKNWGFEGLL